jgi:hypothetical protein
MIQAFVYPAEQRKVISLAEYRRRIALSDNEHPPPSPCPAAAGRPQPPTWIDATAAHDIQVGSLVVAA